MISFEIWSVHSYDVIMSCCTGRWPLCVWHNFQRCYRVLNFWPFTHFWVGKENTILSAWETWFIHQELYTTSQTSINSSFKNIQLTPCSILSILEMSSMRNLNQEFHISTLAVSCSEVQYSVMFPLVYLLPDDGSVQRAYLPGHGVPLLCVKKSTHTLSWVESRSIHLTVFPPPAHYLWVH